MTSPRVLRLPRLFALSVCPSVSLCLLRLLHLSSVRGVLLFEHFHSLLKFPFRFDFVAGIYHIAANEF